MKYFIRNKGPVGIKEDKPGIGPFNFPPGVRTEVKDMYRFDKKEKKDVLVATAREIVNSIIQDRQTSGVTEVLVIEQEN